MELRKDNAALQQQIDKVNQRWTNDEIGQFPDTVYEAQIKVR